MTQRKLKAIAGIVAVVMAVAPLPVCGAPQEAPPNVGSLPASYAVTEIVPLPGDGGVEPKAINDRGDVVGEDITLQGVKDNFGHVLNYPHAFLWRNGVMTAPLSHSKTVTSYATAINNRGDILGDMEPINPAFGVFFKPVLLRDGRVYRLAPFYWHGSAETGTLDDQGRVLGTTSLLGDSLNGQDCFWQVGAGKPTLLQTRKGGPGGVYPGRTVLTRGHTVDTESSTLALFLYDHGRQRQINPAPGFPRTSSLALNRRGDLLIAASDSDWYQASFDHTFLWSAGVLKSLPKLDYHVRREVAGVSDMNNALVAVGTLVVPADTPAHVAPAPYAFRFNCRTEDFVNLNTLLPASSGWTLDSAVGINEKGQIVGIGHHQGQKSAFVLTPLAARPVF